MVVSRNREFNGKFVAKLALYLSGINVAAISGDARANAMQFKDCIAARINLIMNVVPVPLGSSIKMKIQSNLFFDILHNLIMNAFLYNC